MTTEGVPQPTVLHINLRELLEFALVGPRRASVFMGLGINAAEDARLTNFRLPTLLTMSLVPNDISDEQTQEFKRHFALWIIGSALREMIDHFSVYLDRIFNACCLFEHHGRRPSPNLERQQRQFHKMSASEKLRELERRFCVSGSYGKYLDGLKAARNCLSHRLGIVGPQDCANGTSLTICWMGNVSEGVFEDGKKQAIPRGHRGPFQFEDAVKLFVRFEEQKREFGLGTQLLLEPHELAEICWTMAELSRQISAATESYAVRCGVGRVDDVKPPIATT